MYFSCFLSLSKHLKPAELLANTLYYYLKNVSKIFLTKYQMPLTVEMSGCLKHSQFTA